MNAKIRNLVTQDVRRENVVEELDGGLVLAGGDVNLVGDEWHVELALYPVLPPSHPSYRVVPLGLQYRLDSAMAIVARPSRSQVRAAILDAGLESILAR
jgi:hypothetical protein